MIEIPQPIRFSLHSDYLLANKQVKNRYRYVPSLIVDKDHLLPFEILKNDSGSQTPFDITSVKLYERGKTTYTELVDYLTFRRYSSGNLRYNKCNVYEGTSTVPPIGQGIYYLVITDGTNTWTSCDFKVCFPEYSILFEFTNSKSMNFMVYPMNYKIRVESRTFDLGEYLETSETIADDLGNETTYFNKKDKLMGCRFLSDMYTYDALQFMSMHDTIYLTDETGNRNQIKISSIEQTAFESANHIELLVKYFIPDNQIYNINNINFYFNDFQKGLSYERPESGIYVGKDKIKIGRKKIKI